MKKEQAVRQNPLEIWGLKRVIVDTRTSVDGLSKTWIQQTSKSKDPVKEVWMKKKSVDENNKQSIIGIEMSCF